jgi:hypothetical protein
LISARPDPVSFGAPPFPPVASAKYPAAELPSDVPMEGVAPDAYAAGTTLPDGGIAAPLGTASGILVGVGDISTTEEEEIGEIHKEMQAFIDSIEDALEDLALLKESASKDLKEDVQERIKELQSLAEELGNQIEGKSENQIDSVKEWEPVKAALNNTLEDTSKLIKVSQAQSAKLEEDSRSRERLQDINERVLLYESKISKESGEREFSMEELMDLVSILEELSGDVNRSDEAKNLEKRILGILNTFQADLKESQRLTSARLKDLEQTQRKNSEEYKKLQGVIEDLDKLIETIGDPENDSPELAISKLKAALDKDEKLKDVFLAAVNGFEFEEQEDGTYTVSEPKDPAQREDIQRKTRDWYQENMRDFGTFLKYTPVNHAKKLFGETAYRESLATYNLNLTEIIEEERKFNERQQERIEEAQQEEKQAEKAQEKQAEERRVARKEKEKEEAKRDENKGTEATRTGLPSNLIAQHLRTAGDGLDFSELFQIVGFREFSLAAQEGRLAPELFLAFLDYLNSNGALTNDSENPALASIPRG